VSVGISDGVQNFVEFKSGFTGGHVQFVLVGHDAQRGWRRNTEYEVQFKAQQAPEFEAIKREVEQRVAETKTIRAQSLEPSNQQAPQTAPVVESTPRPTDKRRSGDASDVPDLTRKLAELRDAGVISNEEFEI
jgi:hypothetical protein